MTDPSSVREEGEITGAEGQDLRFSEVLTRLAAADGERLSVNDIVAAFGERGFGALMLCVGLLNLVPWPPGGTTITGAPLLFITLQLALGRERLWLPRRICSASFSRSNFQSGLKRVLPWLEKVERLTKPRLAWAVGPVAERAIGAVCFLLACIIVLPIFGGNFAPAVAVVVFAVAIVQRDGVVALLGWAALAASIAVLALAARLIWEMAMNAWSYAQGLLKPGP
jgi:hypothetical protein